MASHLELLAFCLDEKGNWVGLMRICAEILELGRGPRGLAASHLEKELFFLYFHYFLFSFFSKHFGIFLRCVSLDGLAMSEESIT